MTRSANYTAVIGRILLAVIFLASGFQKLLQQDQTIQYIQSAGLPRPEIAYWIAVGVELIGGIGLVLGLASGFCALVLAVFTLAAAVGFHSNFSDTNQIQHFLKNLAIAGGLLQVTAFGSGGFGIGRSRSD